MSSSQYLASLVISKSGRDRGTWESCASLAQIRSASLSYVSVEDFTKFCEFAYTGDYSTPSCTTRAERSLSSNTDDEDSTSNTKEGAAQVVVELLPSPPPTPQEEDEWANFLPKKKAKKPPKTTLLREFFKNQSYCSVPPRQ
jgi:hypothetical protein